MVLRSYFATNMQQKGYPMETKPVDPRFMNLILGNIADGVFTVDHEFRITFFNQAAEQITGYSKQNVLGKTCSDVFRTPICSQDCPLRRSIRTGQTVKNFEINILNRKGKALPISVCTAPLIDHQENFLGGVETFRDMSSIKELRREISSRYTFQDIISKNAKLRQIFDTLPNIAQTDATILIQGHSGTGKELLATAIHNISPRVTGPLIKVNCGALPETLLESELFGHVKGAFTDAKNARLGRFQAAHEGTILLDEIGDLPLAVQVKLLRVLEQREFEPLGSDNTIKVDVRIVAATNQDLERMVAEGKFREDLFYRLNVIRIRLPDLCERKEDIPLLVEHFIERFNHQMGRGIHGLDEEAMALLVRYPFPGNVRELENALEHAYIVTRGPQIGLEDLPNYIIKGRRRIPNMSAQHVQYGQRWDPTSAGLDRQGLTECLQRNLWNISRAAQELGIHRTTLWRKLKKFNISKP